MIRNKLEIGNLIRSLNELEKFKSLLFDQNQYYLFQNIQKPFLIAFDVMNEEEEEELTVINTSNGPRRTSIAKGLESPAKSPEAQKSPELKKFTSADAIASSNREITPKSPKKSPYLSEPLEGGRGQNSENRLSVPEVSINGSNINSSKGIGAKRGSFSHRVGESITSFTKNLQERGSQFLKVSRKKKQQLFRKKAKSRILLTNESFWNKNNDYVQNVENFAKAVDAIKKKGEDKNVIDKRLLNYFANFN